MPPYSPEVIANAFIDIGLKSGHQDMSPMKLLKLVYISHGWYLGHEGEPLINGNIQAWEYGPVIPSLYYSIKEFGRNIVEKIAAILFESNDPFEFKIGPFGIEQLDASAKALVEAVWASYGHMTAIQLSNLTHKEGSPWHQIVQKSGGHISQGLTIPDEIISCYYKAKIEANNAR